MTRAFTRILWGEFFENNEPYQREIEEKYDLKYDPENALLNRRSKIEVNIQSCLKREHQIPTVTYTFGKKNHEHLKDLGLKSVLVNDEPYAYHPTRQIYQHKLEAHQYMLDDYDEVVFLDWDTYIKAPLPDDFWDVMNEKDVFQGALRSYRSPRLKHRETTKANKAIPTGAFVYMRGSDIAEKLLRHNQSGPNKWSCEPAMGMLVDEITDGWKGFEVYWERFEPVFYTARKSPYKFALLRGEKAKHKFAFSNDR